jgi:hypothetical protein
VPLLFLDILFLVLRLILSLYHILYRDRIGCLLGYTDIGALEKDTRGRGAFGAVPGVNQVLIVISLYILLKK